MKLSRDTALKIHYFLDQFVPPIIRDTRWIMYIPFRVMFGNKASVYLDFKDKAFDMTEEEFTAAYAKTQDVAPERESDCNNASIDAVMKNILGQNVLEVGCGRGFLSRKLAEKYKVTAADIIISNKPELEALGITCQECNMEKLPFADRSFDTVVSTHTLEHVRNLVGAVKELRRVAKRMVIVVPRQRPYKYTFDLHLNFFPYPESLFFQLGKAENAKTFYQDVDGDMFYMEDYGA